MTPEEVRPLLRVVRDGTQTTEDITQTIGLQPEVVEYRLEQLHRQGYLYHRWRQGAGAKWEVSGDGLRYLASIGG